MALAMIKNVHWCFMRRWMALQKFQTIFLWHFRDQMKFEWDWGWRAGVVEFFWGCERSRRRSESILTSRRSADWWERMDNSAFGSASCSLLLLSQLSAVSCYGDRYFYGYVSYWASCRRVYRYYRRALSLDAYGHSECGAWGVLAMTNFCCMDRIESLRWGRRALEVHRKLQEMVWPSSKECWWSCTRDFFGFFCVFRVVFGGRRRRRCQREVKRPIISQSSTSHRHHIYKNIVSPVESELGGVEGVLEGAEAFWRVESAEFYVFHHPILISFLAAYFYTVLVCVIFNDLLISWCVYLPRVSLKKAEKS